MVASSPYPEGLRHICTACYTTLQRTKNGLYYCPRVDCDHWKGYEPDHVAEIKAQMEANARLWRSIGLKGR